MRSMTNKNVQRSGTSRARESGAGPAMPIAPSMFSRSPRNSARAAAAARSVRAAS
jgi:hypothetical protein